MSGLEMHAREVQPWGSSRAMRLSWWVQRENGWTKCQGHVHLTPEAATACWREHVVEHREAAA